MSEDASYELQRAIVAALTNDATVATLVAGRIYDHVPRDPATGKTTAEFPFVSFGPEQNLPENLDCIDAEEIVIQINGWSRDPGFMEVKRIAKAVKNVLHEAELPIADNGLVYFVFDGRRILRDPDGLTSHAVLTFRAGVENH